MYEKVNITENHLQVISLFTKGFFREYYIREVQKMLGISPRTSQLILADLEKKGVLESRTRGRIRGYKITRNATAQRYIVLAEQYKAISFLENRLMIREIIEKANPFIKGIGMIFGSHAKGTVEKDSDLDILVIGDFDEKELERVSKIYGIEISVKTYPPAFFDEHMKNDVLLREVLDNHVIFLGVESFINSVFRNG